MDNLGVGDLTLVQVGALVAPFTVGWGRRGGVLVTFRQRGRKVMIGFLEGQSHVDGEVAGTHRVCGGRHGKVVVAWGAAFSGAGKHSARA